MRLAGIGLGIVSKSGRPGVRYTMLVIIIITIIVIIIIIIIIIIIMIINESTQKQVNK